MDDNKYRWAGIICAGDATLILKGTNTVRGFYNIYPSIYVPVGRNLTIKGEGSLEASSNGLAAGIGGEYDNACGNIIIDGGTITATGGRNAAGIGGGYYGDCGNITINGGTITAKGSIHAADIGGGYYGKCGNITINGGTIIATGSAHAAGIGAGYSGKCGDITINSGNVTANGSDNAAGIGGGYSGKCGNITINDGNVTATGSNYAAGIGGGRHGDCGDILIDGGTVNATGGKRSAGIGGGEDSRCASVTISNNVISVTATKGNEATHSVGDGFFVGCRVTIGGVEEKSTESTYTYAPVNLSRLTDNYTLQDDEILVGTLSASVKVSIADGATVRLRNATINGTNNYGCQWAGLTCEGNATIILDCTNHVKGFYYTYPGIHVPEGKTLTIMGSGSLTASSNGYGAGIGGGSGSTILSCGNIVIKGGTITATGGQYSAAIGGGAFNSCGNITITNDAELVAATRGEGAPYSIGAGYEGTCGTVTIDGVEGAMTTSPYEYKLVDLSTLSADYTVHGVQPITGTLVAEVKISIADGGVAILRDVVIDTDSTWYTTWAGLTCEGNATIILEGSNIISNRFVTCPCIHVPEEKTLIIKGTGSLDASSNGWGAAIGAGKRISCGNIIIDGGTITATTVRWPAAIGGGWNGNCGNITITKNVTKVTARVNPRYAPYTIGAGYGGSCGTVTIGGQETGPIATESGEYVYEP